MSRNRTMSYKYKGFTAEVTDIYDTEGVRVSITKEGDPFALLQIFTMDDYRYLNKIINRIKKEINLLIKEKVANLIEENRGNIKL